MNFILSRVNRWWADLPLRWKGATVLLIPVTALICGFASVYLVGLKADDAETQVAQIAAVRYHVRSVFTSILDAETSVRGFVISRDAHFLDRYKVALQNFPRSIRELTNLAANNSQRSARVNEIKTLAHARLDLLSAVVSQVAVNDDAKSRDRESQLIVIGERLMAELRPKITAMDDEEAQLQEIRSRALQSDRELSTNVIGLSAIIGVLGGVAGMVLFSHGIVRRVKHIQINAERLAKESPVEAIAERRDEIGELGRRLLEASNLLRRKQQALRESESRLQAVLDNAPSVMYVKDLDGKFVLVNRAFASLLERPAEEILGKTGHDIYPPENADAFAANDRAALEAGRPVQSEETLQREDGTHTFISSKFPLLDSNGKPRALGGISTDITERARNSAALALAKAEAERASQAKSEFLSRMSHELRTPLHAILGFAQLLQKEVKPKGDCECVEHILRSGYRLLTLVNKLLDIPRIEAGEVGNAIDSMDVEEVLQPERAFRHVGPELAVLAG